MICFNNVHKKACILVTLRQKRMNAHATAQGFNVKPGLGFEFDPVQPLLHTPSDLFVQPGRRLQEQLVPAPRGNRVNGRGALGVQNSQSGAVCVASILTLMNFAARLAAWVDRARLAVPSQCAVCHSWPTDSVCTPCVNRFAQPAERCRQCALRLVSGAQTCAACLKSPSPLDACLVAVSYAYPWADLISQFKFQPDPAWAAPLARLMQSMPHMEPALEAADWVVPIPLAPARLTERGFNQSLLLAQVLAPTKILRQALLRVTHSAAQSTQNRAGRLQAMRHAFVVDPFLQAQLKGRRVVVLDDVMTTGATLYAAAQVLRAAGAAHITGMAFARTEN